MKTKIKVFVGGPNDVAAQRKMVEKEIDIVFRPLYEDVFEFEVLSWDDERGGVPVKVGPTWQGRIEAKINPADCDIAIMIFKWRYGSPVTIEEKSYGSASAREVELALDSKKPTSLLLFRHRKPWEETPIYDSWQEKKKSDTREANKVLAVQYPKLCDFFSDLGSKYTNFNVNPWDGPEDFRRRLVRLLHEELIERRDRLAKADTGVSLARGKWAGWPFRGMAELQSSDEDMYCGRDADVDALLGRFHPESNLRFLCIWGASGTGKSSLMRAGLLPKLERYDDRPDGDESKRRVLLIVKPKNPAGDPFYAICEAAKDFIHDPEGVAQELREGCREPSQALCHNAIKRCLVDALIDPRDKEREILLAVDQLEEVWTLQQPAREGFLNFLAGAATHPRFRVIVTIRADAYHRISEMRALADLLRDEGTQYLLTAPRADQLRDMICEPARRARIEIDPKFVERILNDAKGFGEGALPLVAQALRTLRLAENPNRLALIDYEKIDGLRGAVKYSIDQALRGLPDKRSALERLFEHLVQIREEGDPERARVSKKQLEEEGVDLGILDRLVRNRVLLEGEFIELAHQVLFKTWPELTDWVSENQGDLRMRSVLRRDAEAWLEDGKHRRDLKLSKEGAKAAWEVLRERPNIFKPFPIVRDYVEACLAEHRRERLITSVKGGHVTDALEAFREGARLKPEDRATKRSAEYTLLWPAFYAAVTGDDRSDEEFFKGAETDHLKSSGGSLFDDPIELRRITSRGMTPLGWAAIFGHLALVKKLIGKGLDPKQLTTNGSTIVDDAAYAGHLDIMRYLVEQHGVDPNRADAFGSRAIMWAYQQAPDEVVDYLVSKGASLDFKTVDGWNLLTEAVRNGNLKRVKQQIEVLGADINYKAADGNTALHVASYTGKPQHIEVAKYLLDQGAEILARNDDGGTPLHSAAAAGQTEIVEVFLDRGVDPNIVDNNGGTPLHFAATGGHASAIRLLASRKADIDRKDNVGNTPLIDAVVSRQHRAIRALLSEGANPSLPGNGEWTPLHHAAADADGTILNLLLKNRRRPATNALVPPGWTPLMVAAHDGHLLAVRRLLEEDDIDASTTDRVGQDALKLAFSEKHPVIVEEIKNWARRNARTEMEEALKRQRQRELDREKRELGSQRVEMQEEASWQVQPDGDSGAELIGATASNDFERVRALLDEAIIDVKSTDPLGRTALHVIAAIPGARPEIVDALLSAGVPIEATDKRGNTPLQIAEMVGNFEVAQRLVEAGAEEPLSWRAPRVSDGATFLKFAEVETRDVQMLDAAAASFADEIVIPISHRKWRRAPLACYQDVDLLAVEDLRRKGQREQFLLLPRGGKPVLLNWTNEPIYQFNETYTPKFDDASALAYTRFFFHYVRGQLGRFDIITRVDQLQWRPEATEADKKGLQARLEPLRIIGRPADDQLLLQGTVIFKNALFRTNIRIAMRKTKIAAENGGEGEAAFENFSIGQMRLEDEDLLQEDLPIEIPGPPGKFG